MTTYMQGERLDPSRMPVTYPEDFWTDTGRWLQAAAKEQTTSSSPSLDFSKFGQFGTMITKCRKVGCEDSAFRRVFCLKHWHAWNIYLGYFDAFCADVDVDGCDSKGGK